MIPLVIQEFRFLILPPPHLIVRDVRSGFNEGYRIAICSAVYEPFGKAMKVGHFNKKDENKTVKEAVTAYRQTPHPNTGIPPASMMFRDGVSGDFPVKKSSESDVERERERERCSVKRSFR